MSDATETPPPKRERPRPERQRETPAQTVERLRLQLRQAEEKARKAYRDACAVVGEAVLEEARENEEFKERLGDILRRRVKGGGQKVMALLLDKGNAGVVLDAMKPAPKAEET
jgi:hypothetical protein